MNHIQPQGDPERRRPEGAVSGARDAAWLRGVACGRGVAEELGGHDCGDAAPAPLFAHLSLALPTYPVDRYLVESSELKELDRQTDLWQIEPMMRPEDEALQKKLQELLQATTEELKTLTSDLQKIHQPSTAIKTERAPLDEDFNEKIHIEELVTSKFYNTHFINKTKSTLDNGSQPNVKSTESKRAPTTQIRHHRYSIQSQRNPSTRANQLSKSKIKIIQITPEENKSKLSNEETKTNKNSNHFYFKYEPELASSNSNPLSMHTMPQVNIRSECKIQNIFQFEIIPIETHVSHPHRSNNATVEIHYEKPTQLYVGSNTQAIHTEYDIQPKALHNKYMNRKVTKISARDSSESTHSSIEVQKMHKSRKDVRKTKEASFKITETHVNKSKMSVNTYAKRNNPSNADYLPYSYLTLGGITLTDLEKAMSEIPDHNTPLSPILDQIISSQEHNITHKSKAISTSEENLLKDLEDFKYKLTKTLIDNTSKTNNNNHKILENEDKKLSQIDSSDENPEYDDDFEDDDIEENKTESEHTMSQPFRKSRRLTLRETIETHEFIPQITSKDNETQCNSINKKSLKITQTSPKRFAVQPINNVLWPLSTDPNSEVNQAFELEKEIIKKLILEEYGDVIVKGTTSASTSANIHNDINKNTVALQKNTQTSPARVKSVMTSPTRHKTRTTSPVTLNMAVDKETSPQTISVNQSARETKSDIELNGAADLALSLNLSSPKFSLHLPRTSRDVINNLTINKSYTQTGKFSNIFKYSLKRNNRELDTSSTTTAEVSSSEISSLGELKHEECNPCSTKVLSPRTVSSSESSATSLSSVEHLVRVGSLKSDGEVTHLRVRSRNNQVIRLGDELRSEGQIKG